MTSEAQKNATKKYRQENKVQFFFELNKKTRPRMSEFICGMDNRMAYLRHLIAMDMRARGLDTDGLDGEAEEP